MTGSRLLTTSGRPIRVAGRGVGLFVCAVLALAALPGPGVAQTADEPLPVVTAVATDPDTTEAGDAGSVEISRTGPTDAALPVNYTTVYGDADRFSDYDHPAVGTPGGATTVTHTVTIPAGAASAVLVFNPRDDAIPEQPETIVVALSHNEFRYVIGDPSFATMTIEDDEAPTVPAAPTRLVATAVDVDRVNLAWTDMSTNELDFVIERRTASDVDFVELATVPAARVVYADDLAEPIDVVGPVVYRVRAVNDTGASDPSGEATATPGVVRNGMSDVVAAEEEGRYKGWPANGGMWSWDDEIVVLYEDGIFRPFDYGHAISFHEPSDSEQARSTDGGLTWTIERSPIVKPGEPGFPEDGSGGPPVTDLTTPVDFTAPDFALFVQSSNKDYGQSHWYYTTDRARTWNGPYRLPGFGYPTVNARTDYVVNGPNDIQLTLSGTMRTNDEGMSYPFLVRTTDGGLTWSTVSRVGPSPTVQSSTVRIHDASLRTVARDGRVYASEDNGTTWTQISNVGTTAGPNTLVRLDDGRLVAIYGYRSPPFGIRAQLSADDGATWGPETVVRDDGGSADLGYTRAIVRPDGRIVTAYYYNTDAQRERSIQVTILDPDVVFGPGPETQPDPVPLPPTPDAPVGPAQVGATVSTVTIGLTDPADGDLSNYQYSTDNGQTWCVLNPGDVASPVTITNVSNLACNGAALASNSSYPVRLRAVNAGGASAPSDLVATRTTPKGPTAVVQAGAGNTSVRLGFTAPTGNTAIWNYQYSTDNGASWCSFDPGDRSPPVTITKQSNATCTGSALASRTAYGMRLRAVNGANPWNVGVTSLTVVGTTTAFAPTKLARSSSTASSVTIGFAAPPGPAPLSNYRYSTDGGITWCPFSPADVASPVIVAKVSNSSCTGAALAANKTYPIKLRAVDAGGNGTASATLSATTLPGPPKNLTGTVGLKAVTLSWTAPSTAGGLPVTDYVVQYSRDNVTWATFAEGASTGTSTTVKGLVSGARYYFRVAARTAVGQGAAVSSAPTTYTPR
ncbi:MAG: fibronectin type III domain-containing protein [Acidimicrobiia bacterium]|jgi:hypothetical protein